MKEWPFRAATGVGVFLAIWVLWGQFGEAIGVPRWGSGSNRATPERMASSGSALEFRWDRVLRAGQTIEIKGVNGSITAEPATGRRVRVVAAKTARRSDPAEVKIEVVEHAGGVTLCAVYPSTGSRRNSCESGEGGHMSTQNTATRDRLNAKVPVIVGFDAFVRPSAGDSGIVVFEVLGKLVLAKGTRRHRRSSTSTARLRENSMSPGGATSSLSDAGRVQQRSRPSGSGVGSRDHAWRSLRWPQSQRCRALPP